MFDANPDLHADARVVFEVGAWVAVHSVVRRWHLPNGTLIERQWVEEYRVEDDLIVELNLYS